MAKNPAFLQKKIYAVSQVELDVFRHAESNAAHDFEIQQSLEDLLAQDNKVTEKARTDKAEFMTALEAEKADHAEEKSLATLAASQAVSKSSCAQVASDHEA